MFRPLFSVFLLLIPLGGVGCCRNASSPAEPVSPAVSNSKAPAAPNELFEVTEQLAELIQQRLALMPDVARSKWQVSLPVSVPEREAALLKDLVAEATQSGISAEFAQRFFDAQFAASRAVQQQLFDEWNAAAPKPVFENTRDLSNELRPEITRISTQMLPLLAKLESVLSEQVTTQLLQSQFARLSMESKNATALKLAFAPLLPAAE